MFQHDQFESIVCHEWGHALMCYLLGYADSITKLVVSSNEGGNVHGSVYYINCFQRSGSDSIYICLAGTGAEKVCGYRELFALYGRGVEGSDISMIEKITTDGNLIYKHKEWVEQKLMQYKDVLLYLVKETMDHYAVKDACGNLSVCLSNVDVITTIEFAIDEMEWKEFEAYLSDLDNA